MSLVRLDPTDDLVFKLVFAHPEARSSLASLISAVLQLAVPIESLEVLNPEIPKDLVTDKGAILDILVRLANGRQLDVEMQASPKPPYRARVLYYWARLFGTQLDRGESYAALAAVTSISFFAHRDAASDRFHSVYRLLEARDHTLFSPHMEIHLIDLTRRADVNHATRIEEARLLDWSQFLAGTPEEVARAVMRNPDVAKANRALELLSADPELQELTRQRRLAEDNLRLQLGEAHARGEAEGRARGEAEGRARGEAEGRARGEAEGRARGEAEGRAAELRAAILMLAEVFGLEVTAERRAELDRASLESLEALRDRLKSERRW